MANLSLALTFFLAADVVQEGGGDEDFEAHFHVPTNGNSGVQNPFVMVRAMRSPFCQAERSADGPEAVQAFGINH